MTETEAETETPRVWNQCGDCDAVFEQLAALGPEVDRYRVECECGRAYTVQKFDGGFALVSVMTQEERNEVVHSNILGAIREVFAVPGDLRVFVNSLTVERLSLVCVTILLPTRLSSPQGDIEIANLHLRAATVLAVNEVFDEWSLVIK